MKEKNAGGDGGDGYVRADQIDLKSLDEQLQRHLSRAWTMEKNKNKREEVDEGQQLQRPTSNSSSTRQDWEIDPSKLIIRAVIARGTFGTVHRGVYDGQDIAGISYFLPSLPLSMYTHINTETHRPIFRMEQYLYMVLMEREKIN